MKYNDQTLFGMRTAALRHYKESMTFNEFCGWAMRRLSYLIEQSTVLPNWMDADINHLRNYRMKAVQFYEEKRGE